MSSLENPPQQDERAVLDFGVGMKTDREDFRIVQGLVSYDYRVNGFNLQRAIEEGDLKIHESNEQYRVTGDSQNI